MPQYPRSHERGNGNSSGGAGGGSGLSNNKKKFGKNLNKLVKPAAPPIPSDKLDGNVKNGLLLLSTKKPSSGLLASKTNATISSNNHGGILGTSASGIKTGPALNIQSQFSPSTHQVLLSAVVGASQSDTQQKRDAWGVAQQMKDQQQVHYDISQDLTDEEKSYEERDTKSDVHTQSNSAEVLHSEEHEESRGCPQYEENASWDEYGGRGRDRKSVV